MLTLLEIIGPMVIIALVMIPLVLVLKNGVNAQNAKFRIFAQVSVFSAVFLAVFLFQLNGLVAQAAEAETTVTGFVGSNAQGMGFLAAALATSASAIGAGLAVASAAPAAIGAISENSENFGKAMIFVALAEGVAIYGLLISILIINAL